MYNTVTIGAMFFFMWKKADCSDDRRLSWPVERDMRKILYKFQCIFILYNSSLYNFAKPVQNSFGHLWPEES